MNRIAFFVSGSGTNMENLIRKIQGGSIPNAEAALVLSDVPEAKAIEKAKNLNVPVSVIDRSLFSRKAEFELAMARELERYDIQWICLAGFMRILSPDFVGKFEGRIINIHPSLLPAFPGAHGIRDAFEAHVPETGVTVHFVDAGIDTGPIILQKKVKVEEGETLESLEKRIHEVEYEIYPAALRKIVSGETIYPK